MILASIAIASAVRFDSAEPDGEDVEHSSERQTPRWAPRYHVVKKRHGKVRHIHVYPMKHRYSQRDDRRPQHTVSETHEHVGFVDPKDQEHNAAESSKVEKMIDVDGSETHQNDNHIGESHHYESKQKVKVKHHHHHHHHNHVKTVVKKEPYPVQKIIQVIRQFLQIKPLHARNQSLIMFTISRWPFPEIAHNFHFLLFS